MTEARVLHMALLLADPSPCLRTLVLRELIGRPVDDPEVEALSALQDTDRLVADLCQRQEVDGSWQADGRLWQGDALRATSLALMRLGYLGLRRGKPAVDRAVEYVFAQQREDGSWPMPHGGGEHERYSMVPLQTAIPLRGVAACGFATDPRAERAYEWMLAQRLEDGAWPTGIASEVYGYVAGYRRLAHSRWGCRSNTTGSLICLALHPERRQGRAARRALDLLLGRETREEMSVGFEVARLVGAEPVRGFLTFFARFDLGLLLDLCWRVGATLEDQRVADLVAFVKGLRGPYGLWPYPRRPQASRWVTFDLWRSLIQVNAVGDWQSGEPRTPFQPYPDRTRRY